MWIRVWVVCRTSLGLQNYSCRLSYSVHSTVNESIHHVNRRKSGAGWKCKESNFVNGVHQSFARSHPCSQNQHIVLLKFFLLTIILLHPTSSYTRHFFASTNLLHPTFSYILHFFASINWATIWILSSFLWPSDEHDYNARLAVGKGTSKFSQEDVITLLTVSTFLDFSYYMGRYPVVYIFLNFNFLIYLLDTSQSSSHLNGTQVSRLWLSHWHLTDGYTTAHFAMRQWPKLHWPTQTDNNLESLLPTNLTQWCRPGSRIQFTSLWALSRTRRPVTGAL